jgi:hypothetical protein
MTIENRKTLGVTSLSMVIERTALADIDGSMRW